MFTKLYLDTTNPKLEFHELFEKKILFPMILSVLFHTFIYIFFLNKVSYMFNGTILSNKINYRLLYFLIIIMFFGFISRYFHVKDIYTAYNNDISKTRNHLDKLYISWIFIS
jgi:hypothetical protein